jgi:phosphonate transport system substrate-binding protein
MQEPIVVGAVLYHPKVSAIWQIISGFFEENGCPIKVVLFPDYQLQVDALVNRQVAIAWNSPLAWLDSQRKTKGGCRAIAMRDTDQDRVSFIVVSDSGPKEIRELRGKTVAVGAKDSPQATLIPIGLFERRGLKAGVDFKARFFDVLVGMHGDHVGGELEAFKSLEKGESQASAMLDLNWQEWTQNGAIDPRRFRVLATTDRFDHCVFTVRDDFPVDLERKWLDVLFSMTYQNPCHREMMDMEGLKAWRPGRTTGFSALAEAVEKQRFFETPPTWTKRAAGRRKTSRH